MPALGGICSIDFTRQDCGGDPGVGDVRFTRSLPGTILNVGSLVSVRMLEAPLHYCASKAGLKGLTESLAKEVARYGIRVNCLAPGLLEGGLGRNLPEHRLADYLKHCALGRVGTFEEVARLAAFLVSPANGYMSGETVVMDGGV